RMTEAEVESIFGQDFEIPATAEPAAPASEASQAPQEAAPLDIGPVRPATPVTTQEADAMPDPSNPFALAGADLGDQAASNAERIKSKLPSKSLLLERLRARLAEQRK